MTSIGGVTLLVGLVLLAVSSSDVFNSNEKSSFATAGAVTSILGGGLALGGILLIANRSHEPRVRQGGNDAMLDDVPRRAALAPPAPSTPLGFGFAF